jgi:ribosome recycling factor
LEEAIEDEIYTKLGKKIVSMFQWANWAQQQKKQQELGNTQTHLSLPNKGLEEQELLARRASKYAEALRGSVGNGIRNMVDEAQQAKNSAPAEEDHTPVDRLHDGEDREHTHKTLNPV